MEIIKDININLTEEEVQAFHTVSEVLGRIAETEDVEVINAFLASISDDEGHYENLYNMFSAHATMTTDDGEAMVDLANAFLNVQDTNSNLNVENTNNSEDTYDVDEYISDICEAIEEINDICEDDEEDEFEVVRQYQIAETAKDVNPYLNCCDCPCCDNHFCTEYDKCSDSFKLWAQDKTYAEINKYADIIRINKGQA